MNKSVKNYNKNKLLKYIILLVFVIVPSVIIAYKSPPQHYCSNLQYSMTRYVEMFFMDNNYSFQSTLPDERFKELCNILLEKKYIKEPFRYYSNDCSYGLIISDSDEPRIYCKYHGNAENAGNFSGMSSARYLAGKRGGFYLLLAFACAIPGSIIISIKAAYRKLSKKEVEDIDESV